MSALLLLDGSTLRAQEAEESEVTSPPLVVITSDPPGVQVTVGRGTSCVTPCSLSLPPGRYRFAFQHEELEPIEAVAEVTTREQLQVHGRLGEETPWGFILPAYLVGGIFSAGGISALLLYGGETGPLDAGQSDVPADERRFHRNLGIVSLAVGVPLLGLATYLAISGGRPGEVRASVAPRTTELSVGPTLDMDGRLAGLGIVGTF
ncbi:MAG: PEGA domain-containing protein [Deltaproteobacteria bacterium]|nr:PEGA domain-containing protein [Deltaproteobacteria bacterium]